MPSNRCWLWVYVALWILVSASPKLDDIVRPRLVNPSDWVLIDSTLENSRLKLVFHGVRLPTTFLHNCSTLIFVFIKNCLGRLQRCTSNTFSIFRKSMIWLIISQARSEQEMHFIDQSSPLISAIVTAYVLKECCVKLFGCSVSSLK